MPGVISAALLRFLPWIAGALLALGLFAYVFHEHAALRRAQHNFAAARDTVAQLEVTNRQNVEALKQLQKTAAAWQVAQTEVAAEDARRTADARRMLDAIAASGATSPEMSLPTERRGSMSDAGKGRAASAGSSGGPIGGIPVILAQTLDSIAAAQAANQPPGAATRGLPKSSAPRTKKPSFGAKQ